MVVTHSSKFSYITPQLKETPLASSQIQGTIQNWSYYIQNSQSGSTSLSKRIIHPYSSRNTRRSTPKLKFLQTPTFDRRVHKSIKHFSNSFSHYAPDLWNSFPFLATVPLLHHLGSTLKLSSRALASQLSLSSFRVTPTILDDQP